MIKIGSFKKRKKIYLRNIINKTKNRTLNWISHKLIIIIIKKKKSINNLFNCSSLILIVPTIHSIDNSIKRKLNLQVYKVWELKFDAQISNWIEIKTTLFQNK
jgi:hypothetical protein